MMFSNRNSFHKIKYFEIVIEILNGEFLEIILAFDLCAVQGRQFPAACVVNEKCISCGHKITSELRNNRH